MIGIIDYKMGNIQSVVNALEFLGLATSIVVEPGDFDQVDKIILPGVGAFGVGMQNLRDQGLLKPLNRAVLIEKKPILGICLGMQLFCNESFEFGHFQGLGWVKASVRHFSPETKLYIPHVGWNNVSVKRPNHLMKEGYSVNDFYFVHSYFVDVASEEKRIITATCNYGHDFVCAFEKENIFAAQFHPEKSQQAGLEILKRFAEVII